MNVDKEIQQILSIIDIKTGFDSSEPDGGRYFAEIPEFKLKCHSISEDVAISQVKSLFGDYLKNKEYILRKIVNKEILIPVSIVPENEQAN